MPVILIYGADHCIRIRTLSAWSGFPARTVCGIGSGYSHPGLKCLLSQRSVRRDDAQAGARLWLSNHG